MQAVSTAAVGPEADLAQQVSLEQTYEDLPVLSMAQAKATWRLRGVSNHL